MARIIEFSKRRSKGVKSAGTPIHTDPASTAPLDGALTARIAATKRRLLLGGMLQPVEWIIPGERDDRGRRTYTYSTIDAYIEDNPALVRGRIDTDRADETVLKILDPLSITDEHLFRWGFDPPHTYKVKKVDGLIQDEETGIRYASIVTVIQ